MKEVRVNLLQNVALWAKTEDEKIERLKDWICIEDNLYNDIKFVWDDEKPDYVFVTEGLYVGEYTNKFKMMLKKFLKNDPILIFLSGECNEPDFNLFDYSIVFDDELSFKDRAIRIPTTYRFRMNESLEQNQKNKIKDIDNIINNKKYFCNFIYSNPFAHQNRDKIFKIINEYEEVKSLGKHMHNFDIEDESINNIKDWRIQSIKIKELFKFSISSENASYNGYTSEKLLTSFLSNSIPIYWGNNNVEKEFNEKAFINLNKYNKLEDIVDEIKKINENEELYKKMLEEPYQTEEQIKTSKEEAKKFEKFIEELFLEDKEKMKRRPQGTHTENYINHFLNSDFQNKKELITKKIKNKLHKR